MTDTDKHPCLPAYIHAYISAYMQTSVYMKHIYVCVCVCVHIYMHSIMGRGKRGYFQHSWRLSAVLYQSPCCRHHLCHCGQMLTKCKFAGRNISCASTVLQERVEPSVVNPTHSVIPLQLITCIRCWERKMERELLCWERESKQLFYP